MDVDECFYDELSSFMSSPSDYGLNHNDFDDIISSTVSHLDPGLDLNSIIPDNPENSLQGENLFSDLFQSATVGANDLELNFNSFSAFETPNLTTDDSSFSTSVAENPNDLLNICSDNAEIEKLTFGNLLAHSQNRDTPSPTESWGSSSGSSTSGVQSDASDAWQQHKQQYDQIDIESCQQSAPPQTLVQFVQSFRAKSNDSISDSSQTLPQNIVAQSATNQQQPIKVPIPKLIVPTATVAAVPPPKVETKIQKAPDKLQATDSPGESLGKTKTIFLSPNDYKALMQKMNLHGTKGAKINGSVKPQIPKIVVKTGNDKVQCHQNSVRTASSNNPNNPLKISTSARVGSIIDEKMYKKQQRMIKNRESASLSRKKKKEYVVSLEARINHLEKQNSTLKGENVTLRNQLVAFAKTCKCRKGSACEFVLHSLNTASRGEQHVKIAPRPTATSFRQHMNAATVKKNVAVLFAMAFMVTLNAGNFHSYLSKQNLDPESVATVADATPNVNEPIPIGRRLLWVDSEEEYNEKLNRSSRQAAEELVMPPLHFLRPASRAQNATAKSDDWNSTDTGRHNKSGAPPPLTYPSPSISHSNCSMNSAAGNQTEYSRLSLNLQKLINVSGYLNLSKHESYDVEQDNAHGYKFATDYLDLPDLEQQRTQLGKRKTFVGFNERLTDIEHKQRKMDTLNTQRSDNKTSDSINLFKGIKRQDDTFYVLSFNTQHILVSPSTRDKSARPKISLLLPTAEPSHNGDMMMMQVDCEVFNTKELEIKSDMIPAKLRPNVTKWQMKPKHIALNNNIGSNKTQGSIKLQDKIVQPEKPRVRTYFMVGPKNQAAAAASQEKTRFVEYNSSRTLNSDTFDSRLHG